VLELDPVLDGDLRKYPFESSDDLADFNDLLT
jgi:hypothetical protein